MAKKEEQKLLKDKSVAERQELARKIREKNLQLYRESKFKRIKKIKSKLYR